MQVGFRPPVAAATCSNVFAQVMWRLEVSDDGVTWSLADARNTEQPVTYYRRRIAAFGSQEDGSVEVLSRTVTVPLVPAANPLPDTRLWN